LGSPSQDAVPFLGRPLEATAERVLLHELPAFGAVLTAGVALAL
jgi:hypothetical protein